ncbi:hypothetical protein, partial [Bacteroides sp. 51]|uniref:hypothetical protein n=1 Tax=Bacteroides sp. 51 TaxID=2302938 RepID=UPI00194023FB
MSNNLLTKYKIKGIGPLAIYDAAIRLGIYRGIQPEVIYLHRGSLQGAIKLLGKIRSSTIKREDLRFCPLKAHFFRCGMKAFFKPFICFFGLVCIGL